MALRALAAVAVAGLAGLLGNIAGAATQRPCSDAAVYDGQCGSVTVPLDRTNPAGATIEIGYELYPRTDESAPSDGALVMLQGGPGGSTTASRDIFVPPVEGIRENRDIVLVDLRGTGTSDAIDCPQLELQRGDFLDALRACGSQLGASAHLYTTAEAAADVDAVRAELGLDAIDLYGVSYGTQVGQVYALRFGDHLQSLVLDSAYPLTEQSDVFAFDRMVAAATTRVASAACVQNPVCAGERGDPGERFRTLVREIQREPSEVIAYLGGVPVWYTLDESLLAVALLGGPPMLVELDAAGRAYLQGDRPPLTRLVFEYTLPAAPDRPAEFSDGDFYAVSCSDTSFPWQETDGPDVREQAWDSAWAGLPPSAFTPFSVQGWEWAEPGVLYSACIDWPPGVSEPMRPPGATAPRVPTLVLNGDLDLLTPLEGGEEVAASFPGAEFVAFEGYGHGLIGYECPTGIIQRFVESHTAGDTSCASEAVIWVGSTRFPLTVAAERTTAHPQAGDRSTRRDRQAVAATLDTIVDAFTHPIAERGLRGGSYGLAMGTAGLSVDLESVRFVRDLAVSGEAAVDTSGFLAARVAIKGKGTDRGTMRVTALLGGGDYVVRGRIGSRRIALLVSDGCRPESGYCYPRVALGLPGEPEPRPRPVVGWRR